ncbi:hypothetical protein [Streptomyces venezuelae]|uniref:hypothetical protein n=1 Tax=Streptomyces venezuelae TaxID=54571 RepID=UPI003649E5F5
MTKAQQLPYVDADLGACGQVCGADPPQGPRGRRLAQEPVESHQDATSGTVVRPRPGSIAFDPLQGTGPSAPPQAAPTTGRSPHGEGVPETAERRREGARA